MSEAQTAETDFWHVQLLTGEVRYWSLDELDEAFNRGDVDGATFVLKQGDTKWDRLGELLGLDEPPPQASVSVAPASLAPASEAAGAPWSLRPVVSDLGDAAPLDLADDVAAMAFKPKRKKVIAIGAGAGAVLVLLIAGISSATSGGDPKVSAAAPPPVAMPAPPPVAAQEPAPQASTVQLSDDVKRSLIEGDKARAAKAAEKAKARAAASPAQSWRTPKSSQVFHKGGNKFDPLNSAL